MSKTVVTMWICVVGMFLGASVTGWGAPMGTAFKYQGSLKDGDSPANGSYDFKFYLYDASSGGSLLGTETKNGVVLLDGYFDVELDFGSSPFHGDARWLEIWVDDGSTGLTKLLPRQDLTPSPYAIYAAGTDWGNLENIPSGFADGIDNVGAGLTLPYAGSTSSGGSAFSVESTNGSIAVRGLATSTGAGINYGGYFEAYKAEGRGVAGAASGSSGRGVYGAATATGSVTNYGGYFEAAGDYGRGVYAKHIPSGNYGRIGSTWEGMFAYSQGGAGVVGRSSTDRGVRGQAIGTGNVTNYGGYFEAAGSDGRGVYGRASSSSGEYNYGGYFVANGTKGRGVYGEANGEYSMGVYGHTDDGVGVHGTSDTDTGVNGTGGWAGVYGSSSNIAVYGSSSSGYAIYGLSGGSGYAGYFQGKVRITGYLYKDGGGFQIDHPLEPANKYLQHSFVESPDMMNVYNGNVVLDDKGEASVAMPDYFEALNQEFRYQLTAIGAPGPNLYISEEIKTNRFKISGGKTGMKVSWQVTGIRKDPYAQANRIKVEEEKPKHARGYYFHPELYGFGQDKSIDRLNDPKQGKLAKDQKSEVCDEDS